MQEKHLTKSDYKVARDCITKLYYSKNNYPNNLEDNEYMDFLSEGGYVVGKMAQLLFSGGVLIDTNNISQALKQTQELLLQDNIIIYEATILVNNKLVQVDILEKKNNIINLIEVKGKSIDTSEGNEQFWNKRAGTLKAGWKEYIEDIAFQQLTVQEAYPDYIYNSFLLMPDKTQVLFNDNLITYFQVNKTGNSIKVEFTGNLNAIKREKLLALINVTQETNYLLTEVKNTSNKYIKNLLDNKRIQGELSTKCKNCEYRDLNNANYNKGFKECWQDMAEEDLHLLDLYRIGNNHQQARDLILEKKSNAYNIDEEILLTGKSATRRKIQLDYTRRQEEYKNIGELRNITNKLEYPLHFIDFETYQSAIPMCRGMSPYETVAFQWSCHTINKPGAVPVHTEYLNTDKKFPNFEFAETLMNTLGNKGSILIWSKYENTVLKTIYEQLDKYSEQLNYTNNKLKRWLELKVKLQGTNDYIMHDMEVWCKNYYFHPSMKGQTSIKVVLPAIWKNNSYLHNISYLEKYYKEENNEVLSPYKTLPEINNYKVQEGVGAMRAYEEMLLASNNNPELKNTWIKLLKEYCKLDTMAMVIIWLHWSHRDSY